MLMCCFVYAVKIIKTFPFPIPYLPFLILQALCGGGWWWLHVVVVVVVVVVACGDSGCMW